MLRFREFLLELVGPEFRHKPILKNPSFRALERQHKNSVYGELRYLLDRKTGNLWTMDASEGTHGDMGDRLGIAQPYDDYFFHSGTLEKTKMDDIRASHPTNIRNWIIEYHKNLARLRGREY
jgi:hypothetical protein